MGEEGGGGGLVFRKVLRGRGGYDVKRGLNYFSLVFVSLDFF